MSDSRSAAQVIANTKGDDSGWKELPPYHATFGPFLEGTRSSSGSPGSSEEAHILQQSTALQQAKHYQASCYCGRVRYQTLGEPLTAKLCHCRGCQVLHGAPFEWVAIYEKDNVKFDDPTCLQWLYFYSSELDKGWTAQHAHDRILPVKVSCAHCRTPIADEGRHMWLAYCPLFGFMVERGRGIPESFRHSCHLFYSQRCIDLHRSEDNDAEVKKWTGHRNKSPEWLE